MSRDPMRWNQDGGGAPEGARELLRAAARPRPMTPAELARTAARVAPLQASAGAGAALPVWAKGLLLVTGIGLGGLALHGALDGARSAAVPAASPPMLAHLPLEGLLARGRGGAPPAEPAPAAPPPTEPAPAAPPPAAPAPEAEAPRAAAPAPRREAARAARPAAPAAPPGTTAAPSGDELLREARRLEQARAALADSPEASLSTLDAHRSEFPNGQLAEERELIAIQALMRLGRADEARARAEAFLQRFPSTAYTERVRRLTSVAP
ncbi:hypothetical protein WMF31_26275 [Sorangium sp. So ce1036]|uniref:hypothetical protein n=1 Tax=Sorangium sp. So ce1036 TaxID=3133328 RepID=UPI003F0C25B5